MRNKKTAGIITLITGLVLLLTGIYCVFNPLIMLENLTVAFGIAAIVSGAGQIVLYIQMEKRTGMGSILALISGILGVVAGILMIINMPAGVMTIAILFPIWFIAQCVSALFNLNLTKAIFGKAVFWLSLVVNLLGLFFGITLLADPLGAYVSAGAVGVMYLITIGLGNTVAGIHGLSEER